MGKKNFIGVGIVRNVSSGRTDYKIISELTPKKSLTTPRSTLKRHHISVSIVRSVLQAASI